MKKWFCPECGRMGANNVVPLCDLCNYKVIMVEISETVYGRLGTLKWTEGEYRREHNIVQHIPIPTEYGTFIMGDGKL